MLRASSPTVRIPASTSITSRGHTQSDAHGPHAVTPSPRFTRPRHPRGQSCRPPVGLDAWDAGAELEVVALPDGRRFALVPDPYAASLGPPSHAGS
jgi:hypothetical protein